jgi:hypothetical protein
VQPAGSLNVEVPQMPLPQSCAYPVRYFVPDVEQLLGHWQPPYDP